MLSDLMNHIHFTYKLCNRHNYLIVFKIILTRRPSKWFKSSSSHSGFHHNARCVKTCCLKGSYNCLIAQFITHNSIHTISPYTCISPFITGSISHLLTIWITISWSQYNNLSCQSSISCPKYKKFKQKCFSQHGE